MTIVAPALSFQDLATHTQWVCFNTNKMPFNPATGTGAKANDSSTWGTFEQAQGALRTSLGRYAGIGYEFVKERRITGVDLDHCFVDGQLTEYALHVIELLNSYTEFSPGGDGVHIWVQGNIPCNIGPDPDGLVRIEMYDNARYFTITGNHLEGTPTTIEEREGALLTLHREVTEQRQQARETRYRTRKTERNSAPLTGGDSPYGIKALDQECQDVATCAEGGRHTQLCRSAFRLGQLVGGNELTRSTVERELTSAADRCGLPEREADKAISDGIEAGMKEPRSKPEETRTEHENSTPSTPLVPGICNNPATEIDLCQFDADDAGNGDALYALFGNDFLFCSTRGWFVYNGRYWAFDPDGAEVKKKAVITLRLRRHAAVDQEKEAIIKCTRADEKRVNGCVNRFRTLVGISIDEFDNDPDLLNCKNGVVDLRNGSLEPHSHSQRFTYCLSVEYGEANYSVWTDYLQKVVGGGQEVIDYLQKLVGYSFTGHTREEILLYLCGPTRAGKGTFSEVYMTLLGSPLSSGVDFNSFTAKREGDVNNFDLAPLKPARMVFASESQKSQSLNPAKIKQLTGGDPVRTCHKHKDFFTYKPQFKVWMLSNWPVNGDPEDDALWGRVRVIEFPNSFLGKEDKALKERLRSPEVLKGILYWTVQGAMQWYTLGSAGLTTPEAVKNTTQQHRDDLDYVQQWIDACCQSDPGAWTPNEVVTASYLAWCKDNNVQYPKGPKALALSLTAKGYQTGVQRWSNGKNRKGVGGLQIPNDPNDSGNDPLDGVNKPVEPNEEVYNQIPNGSNVSFPGKALMKSGMKKPRNHPLEPLGVRNNAENNNVDQPVERDQKSNDQQEGIVRESLGIQQSDKFATPGTYDHGNSPYTFEVKAGTTRATLEKYAASLYVTTPDGPGWLVWLEGMDAGVVLDSDTQHTHMFKMWEVSPQKDK